MGNTLAVCGHLLNDLYPHIFSYLSPRDLVSVTLTSKRFQHQVSDEVWKELCRRDFGTLLEAHRQALRSSAATSSSGAEPMDEEDGGKKEQKEKDQNKGAALEDEEDVEAGSSSLFRKVLVTGLALRLGRGLAQRGKKDQADDDDQQQPHHHHLHVDEEKSYKELYRTWASRVLIVYHVYSNDQAEQDVERVLRLEGIEATSLVRTNGGVVDKAAESARLKEQLASALPHHSTVLYISNGGVSSQFQATIGDALADFVERGGAVLIFPFATATERLLGRWDELGCNPMLSEAQTSMPSSLRRPPLCPDHPLFKNVGNVTASYRGTGLPAPSAKALAYYEDGNLFAAELNVGAGLVLAVNLFPPSCPEGTQGGRDGGWRAEEGNDVPRVLRNAVRYAMATRKRGV